MRGEEKKEKLVPLSGLKPSNKFGEKKEKFVLKMACSERTRASILNPLMNVKEIPSSLASRLS